MDFQHRPGGKTGVGGVASASDANRDRRERLRQLALETIDLNKVNISSFDKLVDRLCRHSLRANYRLLICILSCASFCEMKIYEFFLLYLPK